MLTGAIGKALRTPRFNLGLRPPGSGFIGMRLSQVKGLFFSNPRVEKAVDELTYHYLRYAGGYIRKVARSSMEKAEGPSPPGRPPHRHAGLLHRFLYFAFDPANRSVVVGPTLINRRSPYGRVTVPELLEYGGTVKRKAWGRRRTYRYPERPYMQPAFELAQTPDSQRKFWKEAEMKAFWRKSIR